MKRSYTPPPINPKFATPELESLRKRTLQYTAHNRRVAAEQEARERISPPSSRPGNPSVPPPLDFMELSLKEVDDIECALILDRKKLESLERAGFSIQSVRTVCRLARAYLVSQQGRRESHEQALLAAKEPTRDVELVPTGERINAEDEFGSAAFKKLLQF